MSGQKDRHTILPGKINQKFPELVAGNGINARCGLIENEHFGAVLDSHGQLQALANAKGKALGELSATSFNPNRTSISSTRGPCSDAGKSNSLAWSSRFAGR